MEAAGLGGAMMGVVLVPGLVAAGIGSLIFVGLDDWTGLGTFSLAIPDIPTVGSPTVSQFLWAIPIGLLAAVLGAAITRLRVVAPGNRGATNDRADARRRSRHRRGHFVFVTATDKTSADVLFSGQDQLARR